VPEIGGPSDHLANERTYLAWVRTGLSVMALGLAVAKFGAGGTSSAASIVSGTLLLVTGVAGGVYGSARYHHVDRDLKHGRFESGRSAWGPVAAGAVLMVSVVVSTTVLLFADA